jgi:hypothetical protein
MGFYASYTFLLLQCILPLILARNISCPGIELLNVCCNGTVLSLSGLFDDLSALSCCEGEKIGEAFFQSTCLSGSTQVPMTKLALEQANSTITSVFLSATNFPATTFSATTSSISSTISTSTHSGIAVVTSIPRDAAFIAAGGLALAMI